MSSDSTGVLPREGVAISGVRAALLRKRTRFGEHSYTAFRWGGAGLFAAVVVALLLSIAGSSSQAITHSGVGFLWSGTWNPAAGEYGAGILVVGRLLAAVPSIVVGLWGLIVLTPIFANQVEPFLASMPLLGWLFRGEAYGPSILLASVVLAVMTLPTMVALSRTALAAVPVADREAALALGATRWQAVRKAVIPAARSGIQAAITLAVGRAMGESIAVAMVIGNRPALPTSLPAPGATLGSAIVNQFAEASPGLGTSSVIAL